MICCCRFPNKDQSTLESLLAAKMEGTVPEKEYVDIVNYLYNAKDATTLRLLLHSDANFLKEEKFLSGDKDLDEGLGGEEGKVSSPSQFTVSGSKKIGASSNTTTTPTASRRVSYENKKLGIERKIPPSMRRESIARAKQQQYEAEKDNFDLPFEVFMKCVLDFQMSCHEKYLAGFKHIFKHYDEDGDGVLSSEQFRKCYIRLRTHGTLAGVTKVSFADEEEGEGSGASTGHSVNRTWTRHEEDVFLSLLSIIDPAETDRVTFSAAAACLNKIGRRVSAPATMSTITKSSAGNTAGGSVTKRK